MRTRYANFIARKHGLANEDRQVIKLDASLPAAHERKYVALRGAGRREDALDAFKMMLSKVEKSLNPEIRGEGYDFSPNLSPDLALQRIIASTSRREKRFAAPFRIRFVTHHECSLALPRVVSAIKWSRLLHSSLCQPSRS